MSHPKPNRCMNCSAAIAGGKSGMCIRCFAKLMPHPVKYSWTDEQDRMLRDAYSRCVRGKPTPALDIMEKVTGYPRNIVRMRARQLGIASTTRKPWRNDELQFIRENAGKLTAGQMADILHRSYVSVRAEMDRQKFSRKLTRGYNTTQLSELLGVSFEQVQNFLRRRWIEKDAGGRILHGSVRHLLIDRMDYLDFRAMDQKWLKEQLRSILTTFINNARRAA